ncbi:S41 family peptidase [Sphingoaurantiacus capsulatus]|uniref:S41 family peptidase n=1 Tax=Sphingoaurantiacus capsulatus TaxID=1771310 RepID=A0ABV7XB33_9SPHN
MMKLSKGRLALTVALTLLSACGGGGSSGGTATPPPSGGGGGGGGGSSGGQSATCSLLARQQWADGVLREWYLFPETLPGSLSPAGYSTVEDYIDALTLNARNQRRDRYSTYLTSIAEENAFFASGASAGFGFRVSTDSINRRAFIMETFEDTPAFTAGIERGDEIVAIGASTSSLQSVSTIISNGGSNAVTNALGANTAGMTRVLRISGAAGTRDLTLTKADYSLTPVSSRYGARIIQDGAKKVGYLNLRTFITAANPQLRFAFDTFRREGVTELIVDFRYNGGGLISTAELLGDLLGGNRASSEVFSSFVYRPEKSSNNSTHRFVAQPESVSPTRIAFITTGASASASEVVINGMLPYLGDNLGMIGANSFGKPVGQVAIDRSACDDRLRVVAFSSRNSANSDAYYDGLASTVRRTCRATDDLTRPLGDAQESSVRQALDFLAGRTCTPIATGQTAMAAVEGRTKLELLTPEDADVTQREVPGAF